MGVPAGFMVVGKFSITWRHLVDLIPDRYLYTELDEAPCARSMVSGAGGGE